MARLNESMYEITVGEHPDFLIPSSVFAVAQFVLILNSRIVVASGVVPIIDGGLAGKDGAQIGASLLRAPLECFEAAATAFQERYED